MEEPITLDKVALGQILMQFERQWNILPHSARSATIHLAWLLDFAQYKPVGVENEWLFRQFWDVGVFIYSRSIYISIYTIFN